MGRQLQQYQVNRVNSANMNCRMYLSILFNSYGIATDNIDILFNFIRFGKLYNIIINYYDVIIMVIVWIESGILCEQRYLLKFESI